MGRAIQTDHEFHHEQVLKLLKKAQGTTRTQAAFAKAIGMNYAYLCQYMKGNVNRPLSPETLLKIAGAAEGGITAEELLNASGFDPEKYDPSLANGFSIEEDSSDSPKLQQFLAYMEERFPHNYSVSGRELASHEYSEAALHQFKESAARAVYEYVNRQLDNYNVLFVDKSIPADLVLSTGAPENTTWSFYYLFFNADTSMGSVRFRVRRLISSLVVSSVHPRGTYFIVTDSQEGCERLSNLSFPLLYQRITILLFDSEALLVRKSADITTAVPH